MSNSLKSRGEIKGGDGLYNVEEMHKESLNGERVLGVDKLRSGRRRTGERKRQSRENGISKNKTNEQN